MSSPRFTVVIPAFNAARTIASALRSVLLQTEQDFEVVVVDDGSTDETAARVVDADDPRVRLLRQPNGGPSAARNAGIAAGTAGYVSMLDADDLWVPEYLEVMGGVLDVNHEAALVYTDAWVLDDRTGRIRRRLAMGYQRPPNRAVSPRELFLHLVERNFIYTAVTVRRSVLDRIGGYDESLRASEDWDLWLRIAALGAPVLRAPDVLAIHRDHPDSLTSDPWPIMRGRRQVCRRLLETHAADAEVTAIVRRQLERWTEDEAGFERPSSRARRRLGQARRQLARPWLWRRRRPEAVERALRAANPVD